MNSKTKGDEEEESKASKTLNKKNFEKKIGEINSELKEVADEYRLLNIKAPDKEFYAAQKNEDLTRLNDVKVRRENQFKCKRVVDEELREVNKQVQTKYDAVGKLRSSLKYKSPERVDDVIRKLEGQLQRLQMKANEERRILQEISQLKESKTKIQDFLEGEEEVRRLKEKQKSLRERRDENVRLITALKQEESSARSLLEQHKTAEDKDWAIYKENLAKRDQLRNKKDLLTKQKKELNDQYRRGQSLRKDYRVKRDSLRGLQAIFMNEQPKDSNPSLTRTIIERKKPYEDEIILCDVLLSYLAKHESQTAPAEPFSSDGKETEIAPDLKGNEDGQEIINHLAADDDIYRGVRRKPSKRGRRRRQHVSEAAKKLEHHVLVLGRFVSLGIQPPAIVAEIPAAERAIREKKKFLRESQKETLEVMKLSRTKSSPFINTFGTRKLQKVAGKDSDIKTRYLDDSENVSKDDLLNEKKTLTLDLPKRHKSCPSLPGAVQYAEAGLPYSGFSKDISASNSEYDLDSPTSMASSTSFSDAKSYTSDDKRKSLIIDDDVDFADSKIDSENVRHVKGQHRVHFAKDVAEVGSFNSISEVTHYMENRLHVKRLKEEGFENRMDNCTFDSKDRPSTEVKSEDLKPAIEDRAHALLEEKPNLQCLADDFNPNFIGPSSKGQNPESRLNTFAPKQGFNSDFNDEFENTNVDKESEYNELQFEIDDIPSKQSPEDGRLEAVNSDSQSSSDESGGEDSNNLQFPMDDVTPVSDDVNMSGSGQRVTENYSLPTRSSGGCSPRRAQDYLYLDKEDSVEVKT